MAGDIFNFKTILDKIEEIKPSEEDKYSDIPGWEGGWSSFSDKAVMLIFPKAGGRQDEIWFPYSQLRIAEDRQSIYASTWILEQKRLG